MDDPILEKGSKATSTELIIYQLSELKVLASTLSTKFDSYKDVTDKRIVDLEKFQATQENEDKNQPKIDIQKIILAAFSLISTVVASALWFQVKH